MTNKYIVPAIALTGGGEGALDSYDGSLLADGYGAIVIVPGDSCYFYILDADSALPESSPSVISPDANAGDKRWIQVGVSGAVAFASAAEIAAGVVDNKAVAPAQLEDSGLMDFDKALAADILAGDSTLRLVTPNALVSANVLPYYLGTIGGTDTYTATASPVLASLAAGQLFFGKVSNANTSTTPTLNVTSKGAKTIVKDGTSALLAGDIPANHLALFEYDGTYMRLLNPKVRITAYASSAELEAGADATKVPASDQLLAASSGTGKFLRQTSPTLISPALGTPASGNLANCTFPTLNQNTTGSSASCTGNAATATMASSVSDASISQSKLKTSYGEVSTAYSSVLTLPGGEYGFWPQLKISGIGVSAQFSVGTLDADVVGDPYASYVSYISVSITGSLTAYVKQRYVTSSGEVYWVFLLLDKITGNIISSYTAPDHPCFGNGGEPTLLPHPFKSYDETKHDIVVLNPSESELSLARSEINVYRGMLEALLKVYNINYSRKAAWPDIPVTVGLSPNYDWQTQAKGKYTKIKQKVITQPRYITTATFTIKEGKDVKSGK